MRRFDSPSQFFPTYSNATLLHLQSSRQNQLKDRKLREAGSYGYLVEVPVSEEDLVLAREQGFLEIEIRTQGEGGVAVYGREFGRYPLDPSLHISYK
jgi:hypothetical protein